MTQACDTFSRTTSGDWGTSEIPNAIWEQQRGTLSTDGSKAIAITNGSFNRATSNLNFSSVPYTSSDFPIEFRVKTIWPSGSGFLEFDFSPLTNPFDLAISKAAASTTVNANVEGGSDTPVITGFTGGTVNIHLVITDTQTTLAVWATGAEPAPQITQSHASGTYNPGNWDFLSLTFFGSSASDEFDTDDFCITYGPNAVTHTQTFTLDAVVAGLGPPVNPPITPSTVSISVAGNDITNNVIYADAEFLSAANAQAGTCHFRVRDLTHVESFTTGAPITLTIDGVREWTGFLQQIKRGYFFDVEDTKCRCHSVPRYFEIIGADTNVLFQRRFLYDKSNPTLTSLTSFPADTPDQTVIEYYCANHLDLSGDGIDTTSLVQHVGTPSTDAPISAAASWSWQQFMGFINFNIGAIYYINPDKKLVWADDETESAPFVISDRPTGGQVGYSEYEELLDGANLINDALVWGAGLGSNSVVFSRSTDATSISTHSRWQVGTALLPIYKQTTADRTSSTYVYGSPQHHRGHKDDAIGIKCAVYRSGLRVAQVIRVISTVFGTDLTLPIRTCRITFETQHEPKWELGIGTEYDQPWMGFDFFPFDFRLPAFPPFQFPPFDFLPPPPPTTCDDRPAALVLSPAQANHGTTGTCVVATHHYDTYPPSQTQHVDEFYHFQLFTSASIPRLFGTWQDDVLSGSPTWVTDVETYNILSFVNPLYSGTGCYGVLLTGNLYAVLPNTNGVPFSNQNIPAVWKLFAVDLGDPKALYGLSGSTPVNVADIEWQLPGNAYVVATGIHPGQDQVIPISVSWNVPNPQYIQFFLRTYSIVGADGGNLGGDSAGRILPRLSLSSPTPNTWFNGITTFQYPSDAGGAGDTHLLHLFHEPCAGTSSGHSCLNLTHIDPPQGSNTTYLYYSTGTGYPGNSYQPGTSQVWYDGLFLRYLLDYTEDYVNGLIIITNSAINEAYGQNIGQTHIAYGCFNFEVVVIG